MSDTYKVIYSPEALDDIRKIYSYIAFYLVDSNLYTVTIIRIVYGRQDIEDNVKSEQQ